MKSESSRFPAALRIRRGEDFRRVFERRCKRTDETLVLFACENGLPQSRLGLSVSRRVGNAVVRNRWKRLLREAFRLERQALPPGIDWVVVPRVEATPTLVAISASLRRMAPRLAQRLKGSTP